MRCSKVFFLKPFHPFQYVAALCSWTLGNITGRHMYASVYCLFLKKGKKKREDGKEGGERENWM